MNIKKIIFIIIVLVLIVILVYGIYKYIIEGFILGGMIFVILLIFSNLINYIIWGDFYGVLEES